QADGGTRTAAITGAFVAVALAFDTLIKNKELETMPITDLLGATSVGVLPSGSEILDLNYEEDFQAKVDMNIVMTGTGEYVEIQGNEEEATFSNKKLFGMLTLADEGIKLLFEKQKEILGSLVNDIQSAKKA